MSQILRRRGKLAHIGVMISNAFGSIADATSGLWRGKRHRWLVPLVVFLCMTGLLLVVAGTVQALAPFIYSIF